MDFSAKYTLNSVNNYSSNQLAFGRNPKILIVLNNRPSVLEGVSTMQQRDHLLSVSPLKKKKRSSIPLDISSIFTEMNLITTKRMNQK